MLPISLLLSIALSLALVFWAWCLVDYTRTDPRRMRGFDPGVWLIVLVLGSVAGGAVWVLRGRPHSHP